MEGTFFGLEHIREYNPSQVDDGKYIELKERAVNFHVCVLESSSLWSEIRP